MLTVEDALRAVLDHARPLPPAVRPLAEAPGCVLAEDVAADLDLPPFDKALVDGYAVRAADVPASGTRLRIVEEILAGQTPGRPLASGEAAAITTGAPLPAGADAVVMVEHTRREGDTVVIAPGPVAPGWNRLERGREMRTGEVVLRAGTVLNPPKIGLLASVGHPEVRVIPCPQVAIVPTGDELVEPDQRPGPGQIRNSNAPMLRALVRGAGGSAQVLPIAPDEPQRLRAILARGLGADVLLITGGVSAGRRDLVPGLLPDLGVTTVFHKVRLRPGKPLLFGVGPGRAGSRPGTLVFGLPGNPVSGLVGFLLFVGPALAILRGGERRGPATRRLPLAAAFQRGIVQTYFPARLVPADSGAPPAVAPLDWAGSADLRTAALADGFAVFPPGERAFEAGEVVEFLPLP